MNYCTHLFAFVFTIRGSTVASSDFASLGPTLNWKNCSPAGRYFLLDRSLIVDVLEGIQKKFNGVTMVKYGGKLTKCIKSLLC